MSTTFYSKKLLGLLLCFLLTPSIAFSRKLNMHARVPIGGAMEKSLQAFASQVKSATKGKTFVKLRLGARAESPDKILSAVKKGTIDLALVSGRAWGKQLDFRFAEIPFSFTEREANSILTQNYKHFENLSAKQGVRLLSGFLGAPIYALSTVAIRDTQELKGKRLMVLGEDPIIQTFAKEFSMQPVRTELEAVFNKIEKKEIEVVYGPLLPMLALQWFGPDRFILKDAITHNPFWIIINPSTWEELQKEIPSLPQFVKEFSKKASSSASEQTKDLFKDISELNVKTVSIKDSKNQISKYRISTAKILQPMMSQKMQAILNKLLK
ncbi:MAG: TRAP transporter substrate-binding protein DctP [Oligoflexales bacterium]|nr:TRAP transporter substrate-binding protein DctP [Oligoflexales bacterium]